MHAWREPQLAELVDLRPSHLLAVEVLLDVLAGLLGGEDAVALVEHDLHQLGIARRHLDVHAAAGSGVLDLEAVDRAGRHAQVLDRDAGGDEAGDHRPLDHARGRVRVAARDHPVAAAERGAVGHRHPRGALRRDVDVADALHSTVGREQGRGAAGLPDQRALHVRAGLDALEGIDANVGRDHALRADRALVADHGAFGDGGVRTDLAVLSHQRAPHLAARAEVRVGVDHAVLGLAELLRDHVVAEHRVAADLGAGRDGAVVADHRGATDQLQVLRQRALPHVHVLAQALARDVDRHLAVERVAVGLLVLGDAADVLPVAVGDVAVTAARPRRAGAGTAPSRSRTARRWESGPARLARARRCRC